MEKKEYLIPEMDVIALRVQKAVLISMCDGDNSGELNNEDGPGE